MDRITILYSQKIPHSTASEKICNKPFSSYLTANSCNDCTYNSWKQINLTSEKGALKP